jgi:hypothetical protein
LPSTEKSPVSEREVPIVIGVFEDDGGELDEVLPPELPPEQAASAAVIAVAVMPIVKNRAR